jgi:CheY-like chemotaxis protein
VTATGGPSPTVVVVDDDPSSAKAIAALFEKAGSRALISRTASEAVQMALDPDVALVSLDLSMPALSGYEVLALIRSHELTRKAPSVPALTISGHTTIQDRARSLAAGFIAHLNKPVKLDAISAALARVRALRGSLSRTRYSRDRDRIIEHISPAPAAEGGEPHAILAGLALALESRGSELIYRMLESLYSGDGAQASDAAGRLGVTAANLGASHLAQLCAAVAGRVSGPELLAEEAIVLAKAELDRVVFTLREEAIQRLP